jgi:bifunctional UDP-N-acetylglucosamine pyrophosphorylase / glucosamine-1-phosphate N-acetyltransferase
MIETLAVILAAGEGTRMKSKTAKVLHAVAGRSMLGHVIAAVKDAGIADIAAVVSPERPEVAAEVLKQSPGASVFQQSERLGTAHAAIQALPAVKASTRAVLILFGDTPLVQPETIHKLVDAVENGAAVAALGFETPNPTGYGRLIVENGALLRIVEHKDASDAERSVTLCNAGLMAIKGTLAASLLRAVGNANAQQEYYLPDVVAIAQGQGLRTGYAIASESEVQGVNDRVQLSIVETVMQQRLRAAHMRNGVTMVDPATVTLAFDTQIARDVTIEPNVVFGRGVTVEEDATIHAFSHLEGATVGQGASVGPFARLRPGTMLGAHARIGNFVEAKAAKLGAGAKANHLTYLGDAEIGAGANIGAGTITCNYDGFGKYRTLVGEGAFVGSNSSLVAPVSIGAGAMVGSGSVITRDVPDGALALGRGRQEIKDGWATNFRKAKAAEKAAKANTQR